MEDASTHIVLEFIPDSEMIEMIYYEQDKLSLYQDIHLEPIGRFWANKSFLQEADGFILDWIKAL